MPTWLVAGLWFLPFLSVYLVAHLVVRRVIEDKVLRDNNGKAQAPTSQIPYPECNADFYRSTVALGNGQPGLEVLLVINRNWLNSKSGHGKRLLVFCQGRLTTIEKGFDILPSLLAAGHHVLMFNYRGVGAPGRATFKTFLDDAVAAHRFGQKVVSGFLDGNWGLPADNQIIKAEALERTALLGYSLGGWAALYAAFVNFGRSKCGRGVVAVMDTGADMYEVVCQRAPILHLFIPGLLLPRRMDNKKWIADCGSNKIVAHGDRDQAQYPDFDENGRPILSPGFDMSNAFRLVAAARPPAAFFIFRNTSHKHVTQTDPETFALFLDSIRDSMPK